MPNSEDCYVETFTTLDISIADIGIDLTPTLAGVIL